MRGKFLGLLSYASWYPIRFEALKETRKTEQRISGSGSKFESRTSQIHCSWRGFRRKFCLQNATQGTRAYLAIQVKNTNASGNSWYENKFVRLKGNRWYHHIQWKTDRSACDVWSICWWIIRGQSVVLAVHTEFHKPSIHKANCFTNTVDFIWSAICDWRIT